MRSRGLSRMRSGGGGGNGGNNGGIGGSGIFGMFGTTIRCDADDDSMYCFFMKLMNSLIMLLFLFYILWFVYQYLVPLFFSTIRKR
jgi:hypothetical protein